MKVVVDEEVQNEDEILIVGVADNSLKDPIQCIQHVLNEIMKAGHRIKLYTYNIADSKRMKDLRTFLKELNLDEELEVHTRQTVEADIWYDDKNFGHAPGMMPLYGSFLASNLIAKTQRNLNLLRDRSFWNTGIEGGVVSDIITSIDSDKKPGEIILPNKLN